MKSITVRTIRKEVRRNRSLQMKEKSYSTTTILNSCVITKEQSEIWKKFSMESLLRTIKRFNQGHYLGIMFMLNLQDLTSRVLGYMCFGILGN